MDSPYLKAILESLRGTNNTQHTKEQHPFTMQPLCGRDAYNYVHASMLWFCDLKQNGTPFGWKSGSDPKTGTFVSLAGKEDPFVRNQI